ncbi:unnamed protein product [Kuraishia capsulata CBS 1993]|uniref:Inhibitor of apoptosis repeat-containing protein n=1 Tax=Kuraishia capsulata CBS 1993 TaxID=1382522 RepID=W6MMX3_9ASCO|nr:uncharacterized protein KUCA_T00002324001 [Kuraishia capsulata CBS 1993]CDK26352.1 unnamed protein product [Kuraishia capsulata CBS 1993]
MRQKPSKVYANYHSRVSTFDNGAKVGRSKKIVFWPLSRPTKEMMASCGFFFTPKKDQTDCATCFGCNKSQYGWSQDEHPCASHLEQSPDCFASTILLAATTRSGDQAYDWSKNPRFRDPANTEVVALIRATYGDLWPYDRPKYKSYPSSDVMAAAGMYYSPMYVGDDTVTCLYCGSGLEGWEENDDPLDEHQRRVPNCYFFQATQPGTASKNVYTKVEDDVGEWDNDDSLLELGSIEHGGLLSELSLDEHFVDQDAHVPTLNHVLTKSPRPGKGVPKIARRRTPSSRPVSSDRSSSASTLRNSSPLRSQEEHLEEPRHHSDKEESLAGFETANLGMDVDVVPNSFAPVEEIVLENVQKKEISSLEKPIAEEPLVDSDQNPVDEMTETPIEQMSAISEPEELPVRVTRKKIIKRVAFSDDDPFDLSDGNDESYVDDEFIPEEKEETLRPVSRGSRKKQPSKPVAPETVKPKQPSKKKATVKKTKSPAEPAEDKENQTAKTKGKSKRLNAKQKGSKSTTELSSDKSERPTLSLISLLSSDNDLKTNEKSNEKSNEKAASDTRVVFEELHGSATKANFSRLNLAEGVDQLPEKKKIDFISPERKPVPTNFDLLNSVKAVSRTRLPTLSPLSDRRNPDISNIFASPSKSEAIIIGSPLKSEMKSSSSIDASTLAMSPVKYRSIVQNFRANEADDDLKSAHSSKPITATLPSSPPPKHAYDENEVDDDDDIRMDDHLLLTDDSVILEDLDYRPSEPRNSSYRPFVGKSSIIKPSSETQDQASANFSSFNRHANLLTSPEAQSTPPGGVKKAIFKQSLSALSRSSPSPLEKPDLRSKNSSLLELSIKNVEAVEQKSHVSSTSVEHSLLAEMSSRNSPTDKDLKNASFKEASNTGLAAEAISKTNSIREESPIIVSTREEATVENALLEKPPSEKTSIVEAPPSQQVANFEKDVDFDIPNPQSMRVSTLDTQVEKPKWTAELHRPTEVIENQKLATSYLTDLLEGPAESLYNDPYGELTQFINSVPSNELNMTFKQWIHFDSSRGKQKFLENTESMIEELREQVSMATAYLQNMS